VRVETSEVVKPVFTAVQLVPLFVERKTPDSVAANRFDPFIAKPETYRSVKPVFTAVQLVHFTDQLFLQEPGVEVFSFPPIMEPAGLSQE